MNLREGRENNKDKKMEVKKSEREQKMASKGDEKNVNPTAVPKLTTSTCIMPAKRNNDVIWPTADVG